MPNYEALRNKQTELIRKAVDGSVFIAPVTAPAIATLTEAAQAPATGFALKALPEAYDDLGWMTPDGAQFSRNVSSSDITSWGSIQPTRSDITSDVTTLQVTAQETKLLTLGLATGADLAGLKTDPATGELKIAKPSRPKSKTYRVLTLAVDEGDFGEIYIARFLPRAKVTSFAEQAFNGGDQAIQWGVTFTGEEDSALGFSESYFFGGNGWQKLIEKMGFTKP